MTRRSSIYDRSSKKPVRQFVSDVDDAPARADLRVKHHAALAGSLKPAEPTPAPTFPQRGGT